MPTIKQLIRNTRRPIEMSRNPPLFGGCPRRRGTCTRVDLILKDLLLDNLWVEPKSVNYTSSQ
ncbi:hypothetical protein RND71_012063 [Anisodus tanguticus]|uniref:Ribosomal protein S12 n=1 Tax=Anisodus tanguticus TaxID=243964 RepID=A0AAE1SG49_9SOLA|nr:hypothetical protein RND71_012063 [Anisodus tanguticus]